MDSEDDTWISMTVGDFLTLNYGKSLPEKKRKQGNIPVYGSNGITGYHDQALVSGPGIVVGRKGTSGAVHYCKSDFFPIDTTFYITPSEHYDLRFVYYLLQTLQLDKLNFDSAVPGLNRNTAYSIPIKIPQKQEQQKIASILGTLDSKIELNHQMNLTLERIAQTIFKHWFIDFEFSNEEGKPYKSSGGEMVYSAELEKEIPKGWEVKSLKEVSYNFDSKRIPLSSRERAKRSGKIPYYGATGIMDYINDYIFEGIYVLLGEDGSVIDDEGHPILQYVWGKFWVNNHAHVIQGNGISNEFLYLFLRNTNVQHLVTGAVQPKINQQNLNSLKFVILGDKTIKSFEKIIQPIFSLYRSKHQATSDLAQIRNILLPKLISGEIRVRGDEIA